MYGFISGRLADKSEGRLVVENNGIGYEIGVSGNTFFDAGNVGDNVKIYTYLYVREDTFALYGFLRREEKNLFLKLIDISGVGPKLAMQILGGYDLKTLTVAIAAGDVKTLCKIKGLGKKTAELIVLNLKEQAAESVSGAEAGSGGVLGGDEEAAVSALMSLGLSGTEAVKAVGEVAKTVTGTAEIIAAVLRKMN